MLPVSDAVQRLSADYALTPLMAAEIECYILLADETGPVMDHFWMPVDAAFKAAQLPILKIEKERGLHQYEVVTDVMSPARLVDTLTAIRRSIEDVAKQQGVTVHFAAKPFADQPSSGLHLHLHLADAEGINVFHKTEEWTSDYLRYSLGGLLADMSARMPIFFPNAADYARLQDVDHVPKIMGWGVNNRYCALRIPMDPDHYHKRIEHRVPCANADPEQAIAAMLHGVLLGIDNKIEAPEQVYGKTV